MANDRQQLSDADLDRIYGRRIVPDILGGFQSSARPAAVMVAGQPGAGKTYAAGQVRAHLATTASPSAVICGDELREYHPHWQAHGATDLAAAEATRHDVGQWYARLTAEGIRRRVNLILETSLRQPQAALALTALLKNAGYEVSAVVLATDRDQSRQATLAYYDLARRAGVAPRFVAAAAHDGAYTEVRDALARIEADAAVDRIQLVARDGRQLYANETDQGHWVREPRAVYVLDDFRERRLTARELADSALRWQTLVQRLTADPSVPREVASQAIVWRDEAARRADADPDARHLVERGREAEAFRTMNRYQFLREFPQYAKAVERLDEAIKYAETTFEHQVDRERFIAQARERLTGRIAEGRFAIERAREKERVPKAR